ncbi:MAG: hypothetical protein ACOC1K_05290 [Nanoarchaeota archaeon]
MDIERYINCLLKELMAVNEYKIKEALKIEDYQKVLDLQKHFEGEKSFAFCMLKGLQLNKKELNDYYIRVEKNNDDFLYLKR